MLSSSSRLRTITRMCLIISPTISHYRIVEKLDGERVWCMQMQAAVRYSVQKN